MDDLIPDFVAETRDTLQAVAGALVAWEADPADRARLDEIFRFVHTVKGSCGFLDLPRLQRLSHAAEDALAEVRGGARTPDAPFVSAVLAVIDRIGELAEALESGEAVSDADEPRLLASLAGPAGQPAPPLPVSERVGVARAPARTVRLPVDLLDRMMASVSEIVLARNALAHAVPDGARGGGAAFERLSHCVGELREAVTRARMARIDTLFGGLPRMVRDLALDLGKQVRLELDGGEVELDREMIEMVRDPLLHLVRNAVDHGIEPPAARAAAGKPAAGRLAIRARQSGNRVTVEIADDGAGIHAERLRARALAAGMISPAEAAALDLARTLELVFRPGLSTADRVSAISGRGVGMDVVRANVERLGGTVQLDSAAGEGTRLLMQVPLTLTIIPALTVAGGGQCFAVPRSAIEEIVRPGGRVRLLRVGGGLMADVRGRRVPVAELAPVLGIAGASADPAYLVLLQTAGGGRYALGVDMVHDHQELVVKPAAPAVMATGLFAGTTLPDDSRPMLLLDVNGIAAAAGIRPSLPEAEAGEPAAAPSAPTLLFRDLDGHDRAVRLAEVERIEEVGRERVVETGGRILLAGEGLLAPVAAAGPLPARARLRVLRLRRGDAALAYAVDEVADVAAMAAEIMPSLTAGPALGVLLHEGRPVELLDVAWLARAHAAVSAGAAQG